MDKKTVIKNASTISMLAFIKNIFYKKL